MLIFLLFIFFLYCFSFSEANQTGNCGRRIVGFLNHMSRNNFTDNQAKMLTHLIHDGIKVVAPAKVDLFGSRLEHIMRVANRNPHLMVIIGLDIRGDEIQIFRQILKDNDLRKMLINNIIEILKINKLNGVNFDWFWPYDGNDESLFERFLCDARNKFDENNLVNSTISFTMKRNNLYTNMRNLVNCSNFVNLYLEHYFWAISPTENQALLTGPMSPLFYNDYKETSYSRLTIFQTLNNFACYSDYIQKLNMIFPGYGCAYNKVSNPLWDGDGMWRISEQIFFYMDWKQIRKEYADDKFIFHEPTKTSYIFDEEKRRFISLDEPKSIRIKLEFAERYGIGGVGLHLERDDMSNTLLDTITLFQKMCDQNSSFFQCNSTVKYDSYFYQVSHNEITIMEFIQINIHYFISALIIIGIIAIIFLKSSRRIIRLYTQQLDPPKLLKIETTDDFSLKLIQEIGKGRFGEVFLAEWGNKQVALKTIDKQIEWSRRQITRESAILANLNHENICTLHGLVELDKNHWGLADCLGLISEFASLGDLLSFLRARSLPQTIKKNIAPPPLMPSELCRIALMLARALQYLFTKNILHRDIAARNCLVFGESDAKCFASASRPNFKVKLSDFGMARGLNEYSMAYYMRQISCICFCFINKKSENVVMQLQPPLLMVHPLPIRWSSPETLKERKYSFASEIWSYGILLYEIYSYGKIPFEDAEEAKLVETILKGGYPRIPTNMPTEIKKILESCWNLEPKKRICINDLCNKMELIFAK